MITPKKLEAHHIESESPKKEINLNGVQRKISSDNQIHMRF